MKSLERPAIWCSLFSASIFCLGVQKINESQLVSNPLDLRRPVFQNCEHQHGKVATVETETYNAELLCK